MRPLEISKDIIPIAKFKARASEVVNRVRRDGRPMVITLNGEPAAVLISARDYDQQTYRESIRESIEAGLEDEKAGRVLSDAEFRLWANRRFGAFKKTSRR
jgi:prevent-host-death family protein